MAEQEHSCHAHPSQKLDYLLAASIIAITLAATVFMFSSEGAVPPALWQFSESVIAIIHRMWWGVLIGIAFVGILSHTPKDLVTAAMGTRDGLSSILRATLAGVALDLCSHGILMVGMKLYERGASLGQVMAFLIASPWNSFSLTVILIALVGLKWTFIFMGLSLVIAVISGLLFDSMVRRGELPANPNRQIEAENALPFYQQLRAALSRISFSPRLWIKMLEDGVTESRVVLRWVLFGVVLASLIRTFVSPEIFAGWFGPTLGGLWLTLVAATVIEVCSEGATPIAADLLTRAHAPGNSFTFLMAGVSTDYTEIMVLQQTTNSWKIALYLPLVTLPQVMLLGWLLNQFS